MSSIDPKVLDSLKELERRSGGDLLTELVQMFEADNMAALQAFRDAFAAGDLQSLFGLAHSLKSSSANIGAERLGALYDQIESLKGAPDSKRLRVLVEEAEIEFGKAMVELRAALSRKN